MSGPLRVCFVTSVFLALASSSPAFSSPFADWFNPTPPQPSAPAAAEPECLPRPGKTTADGQHWVYRVEGHRKCWFQAEGTAPARKSVRHHAIKHRAAASEEKETPRRKPRTIVNARAELLRSAEAEAAERAPPVPPRQVADAGPLAASAVAAPPVALSTPAAEDAIPRQVDVDSLLAAAPADSEAMAAPADSEAVAAPAPVTAAFSPPETENEGRGWIATCLGVLLMALGLVSVLGSSRSLRGRAVARSI